jgi:hypothetical protein
MDGRLTFPTASLLATCAGALLLTAGTAGADTIRQSDGKTISGVKIVDQTLSQVIYKRGNNESTVPSEDVISVEFERMPRELDQAQGLIQDGDLQGALDALDGYVEAQASGDGAREKWAPAYAAWRAIEVRRQLGDLGGVVQSADRLIQHFGNSRYLPAAYLAKANAQLLLARAPAAKETLDALAQLISSRTLSKRWELECRLGQIAADTQQTGDGKRALLSGVAAEAGSRFPSVANRAGLMEGESYLVQAEASRDRSEPAAFREQAKRIFERIVADSKSDDSTLAGAYTGLGDCLYYQGASADDKAMLRRAAENYLRVVCIYEEEAEYVPKALFYAMRAFGLMQDKGRARDMKAELARLYPDSPWAEQARRF